LWNTSQTGPCWIKTYDRLCRKKLVGPQCTINILFAIYQYAVAATMQLTFLESKQDLHLDQSTENAVVFGKVTARNTALTDPDAFSTLFATTTYDYQTIF
jgi:hypothetical protein